MSEKRAIGIDLGASRIKGVLLSESGEMIERLDQPIPIREDAAAEEGQHWKEEVRTLVTSLKEAASSKPVVVGLAAPGIANKENSAIVHMPDRLQGLEGFVWQIFLEEDRVWVLNDAHAALMGEARFGAGKGFKNIVMLTLGTGVGGAIIVDGQLYQGNHQMAGHLGHISVDSTGSPGITKIPGSLEDAVGSATVARRTYGHFNSVPGLVEAYNSGDTLGTYFWLNTIRDLAVGVSAITNAISPELVILGGGITKAGESLFQPLSEFLRVYEWAPGVRRLRSSVPISAIFPGPLGQLLTLWSKTFRPNF